MVWGASTRLEVFLLKRHGLSDVLGGAYVFPGGKLDPQDLTLVNRVAADPSQLHQALHETQITPDQATALFVAALREAFEESGILFARATGGAPLSAATLAQAQQLHRDGVGFGELLTRLDLQLQASALHPWSRWITPPTPLVMNKRFDTRFFVAAVPAEQIARHDNHEATESVWLTPRAALEQYRDGVIELAPPQIMTLAHLSRHANVAMVLQAAQSRPPALIQPEPLTENGERLLCYPGDPQHSESTVAMPGPTRLAIVNRRFLPLQGFESLFS